VDRVALTAPDPLQPHPRAVQQQQLRCPQLARISCIGYCGNQHQLSAVREKNAKPAQVTAELLFLN